MPRIWPSRRMLASSPIGPRSRSWINLFFSSCWFGSRATTAVWLTTNSTSACVRRGEMASPLAGSATITSPTCASRRIGTRTQVASCPVATRCQGRPTARCSLLAITTPRSSVTATGAPRSSTVRPVTSSSTCSKRAVTITIGAYLHNQHDGHALGWHNPRSGQQPTRSKQSCKGWQCKTYAMRDPCHWEKEAASQGRSLSMRPCREAHLSQSACRC